MTTTTKTSQTQIIRKNFFLIEKESEAIMHEKFQYKNRLLSPCLNKVVISTCLSFKKFNKNAIDNAFEAIYKITSQKPIYTKAKKSISNFKVRKDNINGCKVTLTNKTVMLSFLERLCRIYMPRIRDFEGINFKSINNKGQLSFGIKDLSPFIELTPTLSILEIGMTISIDIKRKDKFSAVSKEESFEFLKCFNFPMKENVKN